jgi:hypothetical protein
MKISSPVGDYEYRVQGVSFDHGRIVVAGSLGVWETTLVIEPSDWVELGRRAALPAAAVGAAVFLGRRILR